jgi:hypothetical protein
VREALHAPVAWTKLPLVHLSVLSARCCRPPHAAERVGMRQRLRSGTKASGDGPTFRATRHTLR